MKILEVLFDTDVVHEYDEHYTWLKVDDRLTIFDLLNTPCAEYNWNDVIYVRYADKSEA